MAGSEGNGHNNNNRVKWNDVTLVVVDSEDNLSCHAMREWGTILSLVVLLLIWHSAVTVLQCDCVVAVLLPATELVEDHCTVLHQSHQRQLQHPPKWGKDVGWGWCMVPAARCTHMVAQLYNQLHNLLHNQLHNLILVNTAQHCLSYQILAKFNMSCNNGHHHWAAGSE